MLDGTSDKNDNSVRIYLPHSVFFYVFCRRCSEGCFVRVLSLQRLGASYLLLLVQYCEDEGKRPLGVLNLVGSFVSHLNLKLNQTSVVYRTYELLQCK